MIEVYGTTKTSAFLCSFCPCRCLGGDCKWWSVSNMPRTLLDFLWLIRRISLWYSSLLSFSYFFFLHLIMLVPLFISGGPWYPHMISSIHADILYDDATTKHQHYEIKWTNFSMTPYSRWWIEILRSKRSKENIEWSYWKLFFLPWFPFQLSWGTLTMLSFVIFYPWNRSNTVQFLGSSLLSYFSSPYLFILLYVYIPIFPADFSPMKWTTSPCFEIPAFRKVCTFVPQVFCPHRAESWCTSSVPSFACCCVLFPLLPTSFPCLQPSQAVQRASIYYGHDDDSFYTALHTL